MAVALPISRVMLRRERSCEGESIILGRALRRNVAGMIMVYKTTIRKIVLHPPIMNAAEGTNGDLRGKSIQNNFGRISERIYRKKDGMVRAAYKRKIAWLRP